MLEGSDCPKHNGKPKFRSIPPKKIFQACLISSSCIEVSIHKVQSSEHHSVGSPFVVILQLCTQELAFKHLQAAGCRERPYFPGYN